MRKLVQLHFEYWLPGNPECHRLSVSVYPATNASLTTWRGKQAVIGKTGAQHVRQLKGA